MPAEEIEPLRRDEQGSVTHVSGVFDRDPIFRDIFTSPAILDPLESLLGPNIVLLKNRHNHATFNLGQPDKSRRLHRDVLQWSRSVVTVILYLDDASLENGCTRIIPTSHFLPFVGTPNNGGTWMDEHSVYADLIDQALPIPMRQGEILIFDSLAFHALGENPSGKGRMSVAMAYRSVDELSATRDPSAILVRGEDLYRGNESSEYFFET